MRALRPRHTGVPLALLTALGACGPGDVTLPPDAWRPTPADEDPLAALRPDDVACEAGWWVEPPFVEVDTGACGWFSVTQPLPRGGAGGRRLTGGLAWDDLALPPDEPPPATGVAVLFVGGVEVFRHEEAIPGPPGFVPLDTALPAGARRGDAVVLHVRNHGVNQWRWLPLVLSARP